MTFATTGLAPEIPEDLYMLIKKVCLHRTISNYPFDASEKLTSSRPSLYVNTWNGIARIKIPSFALF